MHLCVRGFLSAALKLCFDIIANMNVFSVKHQHSPWFWMPLSICGIDIRSVSLRSLFGFTQSVCCDLSNKNILLDCFIASNSFGFYSQQPIHFH